MANQLVNTTESIALALSDTIMPLSNALTSAETLQNFIAELGWEVPDNLDSLGIDSSKLDDVITKLNTVLEIDYDTESETAILTKFADLLSSLVILFTQVYQAGSSIAGKLDAAFITLTNIVEELPVRLIDYLLHQYMNCHFPAVYRTLIAFGIFEVKNFEEDITTFTSKHTRRIIHFDRFITLFSNPSQLFTDVYGWGTATAQLNLFLENLYDLAVVLNLPARLQYPVHEKDVNLSKPATVSDEGEADRYELRFPIYHEYNIAATDELGVTLMILPPVNAGEAPGLALCPYVDGTIDADILLDKYGRWVLSLNSQLDLVVGIGLILRPGQSLRLLTDILGSGTQINGDVAISIKRQSLENEKIKIFSIPDLVEITLDQISVGSEIQVTGNKPELKVEIQLIGGNLKIGTGQADGFQKSILPSDLVNINFDLTVGWSSVNGIYFRGSSSLEIKIPAHIELGPIEIQGLTVTIQPKDSKISLALGADIKAQLGPLTAVVQNIGASTVFSFPAGGGNLGPLQLDPGFKPPNGVGLSIDTGVIKGGGFLYFNYDKGEYFGALELSFQNVIDLKAVGIINTKMPDGSEGFALLILVTAEFTPIQLGFGFTLNGVGGLLGLNRSTNIAALQTGVKTGAVESILFPQDVVANITRIISDLTTIFPIVQAHFIIAPMGKLGWFTPPLITLELGIIIDIPSPSLVIIGVLRCILPTEDAPILKLQVNFAGGIDFDQGLIWFDASLFDSSLLAFTLAGDMALRIGWGSTPMFIVSVGGFHPAFHEVPSDLTNMKRLSISLLSGDNPRLTVQTYFAITSNTVQSGAKVELYAAACGFNIYGFLGYDLLVQFSPFHFIADIYAGLALRSGTSEIAGISVHCELSGPTPWNANGDASLKILFFKISIGFNVTWGDSAPAQIVEAADVLQLIKDALNDSRNWKSDIPVNTSLSVSVKKLTLPPDQIVLHPFGVLSVSQKVVPLKLTINKFGNKKPAADTYFDITYTGGSSNYVEEEFASGNFIQMSDSEKLSRKSFEKMKSGLSFQGTDATSHGVEVDKEVNYELEYVHKKKQLFIKIPIFRLFASIFNVTLNGNAILKSSYSVSKKTATNAPAKVDITKPGYSVVNVSDMQVYGDTTSVTSEAEAYQMHDALISQNPSLQGSIQVVSNFELN